MLAFSQNRVFLGFDVRLRLKNYWFIAQSKLRAELVEKREAGSEKNNVGKIHHHRFQGFHCYNLSTVLNLTRLETQLVSDKKEVENLTTLNVDVTH